MIQAYIHLPKSSYLFKQSTPIGYNVLYWRRSGLLALIFGQLENIIKIVQNKFSSCNYLCYICSINNYKI